MGIFVHTGAPLSPLNVPVATLASVMFWNIPGDACAPAFLLLLYLSPLRKLSPGSARSAITGRQGVLLETLSQRGWGWGDLLLASSGWRPGVPLHTPFTVQMASRTKTYPAPNVTRWRPVCAPRRVGRTGLFPAVSRHSEQRQARRRHAVGRGNLGSRGWGSLV